MTASSRACDTRVDMEIHPDHKMINRKSANILADYTQALVQKKSNPMAIEVRKESPVSSSITSISISIPG